jgi:16S rRNA (guanine527-N7)-methyltransferase
VPTKLRPPDGGWRPQLEQAAGALEGAGLGISALWPDGSARRAAFARVAKFLDLVVTWNARLDLTAARNASDLVDLYLADALVLAARAHASGSIHESWVDVGSGGGAPGFVLGLLLPALRLTLVEPRQKRVAFLRTAVGSLTRSSMDVMGARSDALPPASSDVAISRATFAPEEWLAEGARLARRSVWVLLARAEPPTLPGWGLRQRVDYSWPSSGASRHALEFVPDAPRA